MPHAHSHSHSHAHAHALALALALLALALALANRPAANRVRKPATDADTPSGSRKSVLAGVVP